MTTLVRVMRYAYSLGWILFVVSLVYRLGIEVYAYTQPVAGVVRVPFHPRTVLALAAMMFLISIATGVLAHVTKQPESEGKARAVGA